MIASAAVIRTCQKMIQKNALAVSSKRFFSISAIPIVVISEDKLYPHMVGQYIIQDRSTIGGHDLVPLQPHLRLHSLPDAGGILNRAMKIYAYPGGLEERETKMRELRSTKYLESYHEDASGKPFIMEQSCNIYAEAPLISSTEGIRGLMKQPRDGDNNNANSIYEIRKYSLKLGYDTVPKFLSFYEAGLPSKLGAAGSDPTTSLVTLLYTEVGQLNEVIEIWRHGEGAKAMEKSRVAARSAPEWRSAIKEVAQLAVDFRSTIHIPLTSSPLM